MPWNNTPTIPSIDSVKGTCAVCPKWCCSTLHINCVQMIL